MAIGVFPFIGSYGTGWTTRYPDFVREYNDGDTDVYEQGADFSHYITINVKAVRKTMRNSIHTFWMTKKAASDKEFYIYNPDEISSVDLTGATTTGRWIGLFVEQEINWTRDGRCRYSTTIKIKVRQS